MVGSIRTLDDLATKGADLGLRCLDCEHQRTVRIHRAVEMFRRKGWPTGWEAVAGRFRCGICRSKRLEASADFFTPALRQQRARPALKVIEGGYIYCPAGIDPERWAKADEREKKRLVRNARS